MINVNNFPRWLDLKGHRLALIVFARKRKQEAPKRLCPSKSVFISV